LELGYEIPHQNMVMIDAGDGLAGNVFKVMGTRGFIMD
jgi:hypothetical protein